MICTCIDFYFNLYKLFIYSYLILQDFIPTFNLELNVAFFSYLKWKIITYIPKKEHLTLERFVSCSIVPFPHQKT